MPEIKSREDFERRLQKWEAFREAPCTKLENALYALDSLDDHVFSIMAILADIAIIAVPRLTSSTAAVCAILGVITILFAGLAYSNLGGCWFSNLADLIKTNRLYSDKETAPNAK